MYNMYMCNTYVHNMRVVFRIYVCLCYYIVYIVHMHLFITCICIGVGLIYLYFDCVSNNVIIHNTK